MVGNHMSDNIKLKLSLGVVELRVTRDNETNLLISSSLIESSNVISIFVRYL
jgi:hypothetical protein